MYQGWNATVNYTSDIFIVDTCSNNCIVIYLLIQQFDYIELFVDYYKYHIIILTPNNNNVYNNLCVGNYMILCIIIQCYNVENY